MMKKGEPEKDRLQVGTRRHARSDKINRLSLSTANCATDLPDDPFAFYKLFHTLPPDGQL